MAKFTATKHELMKAYYTDPCGERVGKLFGVTKNCIFYWLKRYNITPIRCGGRNFKDLTGQKFGFLTVIKRGKNKKRPNGMCASWLCKCVCGKTKEIIGTTLRSGSSTSCGCKCGGHNKLKLQGKKFKHLLALDEIGNGDIRWKCLCDCGNTCVVSGSLLATGRRTSCGCQNFRLRGSISPRWSGYKEITGTYWHRILAGAKSRNIHVDLSLQDAWKQFVKQRNKCALTGVELTFASDLKIQTASLDRIDSNKGYTKNNVQWVHKKINSIKSNMDNQEFIELCILVAKTHNKDIP